MIKVQSLISVRIYEIGEECFESLRHFVIRFSASL